MALYTHKISDQIFQFNEDNRVDSYLIIGAERALVVDTLQDQTGLYDAVRAQTSLPLDVVITHGHDDHAGASTREFAQAGCKIHMNMVDFEPLHRMSGRHLQREWFSHLEEGQTFDLGGIQLEVLYCAGHTAGSLVLLDAGHQWLFSGDTVGSGTIWMQIPGTLALNRYADNLQLLYDRVKGLNRLLVYPGHRHQSPTQLTGQYIKDTLTITKRLAAGVWEGEDAEMDFHGQRIRYKTFGYGQMQCYCYDPQNLYFARPDPALEALKDQFTAQILKNNGRYLEYLLFTPHIEEGTRVPLVLYLHGAGERGNELRQTLANPGGISFADSQWQQKHPCFVMAPQCPEDSWWTAPENLEMLAYAVETLPKELPIDADRVYITGLSMGGMGSWAMISRYPRLFAAAMPICGAGDPFAVKAAKEVPVWAFHALNDPVVPITGKADFPFQPGCYGTRTMVTALRSTGNPHVRLTEYSKAYMESLGLGGHASWVPAYADGEAKEWLFSFTREGRYEVQAVMPGLWHIDDYKGDSMYLVEGRDKALLIDTGLGEGDLLGTIHSLTSLPVELAVTHAHGDHMYHADKFERFYMSPKDRPLLDIPVLKALAGNKEIDFNCMTPVEDGDLIDLGGGCEIEVFELAGHTPGSVCFVDKSRRVCFCGDVLGVWMQVPGCTDLSVYRENLIRFKERMTQKGYQDFIFLGGHRSQEGAPGSDYRPNSMERVEQMIELCGLILHDEVDYQLFPGRSFDEPALMASKGPVSIVFTMSNRK